jgi:hypothetical protein
VTAVNFSHNQFSPKKIRSLIIGCDFVALQIDLLDGASRPAIAMVGANHPSRPAPAALVTANSSVARLLMAVVSVKLLRNVLCRAVFLVFVRGSTLTNG